ncbi:MAG: hypothetical protein ACLP5H_31280 [Desulfomonilaceae bacterium]
MTRFLMTAFIALLGVAGANAGDNWARHTVDLDEPGALEALQRDNPAHYEEIHKIMDDLSWKPDSEIPGWIQTHSKVRNFSYTSFRDGSVLLTSYPPKKGLSFTLDGTLYRTLVTMVHVDTKIVPVRGGVVPLSVRQKGTGEGQVNGTDLVQIKE